MVSQPKVEIFVRKVGFKSCTWRHVLGKNRESLYINRNSAGEVEGEINIALFAHSFNYEYTGRIRNAPAQCHFIPSLIAGNSFVSDLLLGRRRVQWAVQLRRVAHPHLPRPLRAIRPLPHRPRLLQPRLPRLPGVPRTLFVLLGPLHLHETAARGVHSARWVANSFFSSLLPSKGTDCLAAWLPCCGGPAVACRVRSALST